MSQIVMNNIPALRFPEFVNDGAWEEKTLGEMCDVLMCKRIFAHETNTNSGVPFYKIGTLGEQPDTFISYALFNEYKAKYNYPKKGEILITCSGTVGKCLVYNGENAYYQDSNIVWLANDEKYLQNSLLYYIISRINWKYLNSTTITRIYNPDLKKLKLNIPKRLAEQQKIAECLSSLDEWISAQTDKIDTLRQHKKGLLQQLFPTDGATVPALRFPEFVNDGDWEEKTLGEAGTFIGGGTPNKVIQKYWQGTIPWISSSDIEDNNLYKISITRFITETAIKESATKIVPRGSVLFVSRVGVGKIAINREELCTSQDFTNFIPSLHTLNLYIGYYFLTKKDLLKSLNQGTSIQGFSKVDLEKIVIKIPSLAEQQKIAECLSSLDEQIANEVAKLETLRQHKQGLLQQLFPSSK